MELTLLICVGLTSADGIEKSQYRLKVFCEHGSVSIEMLTPLETHRFRQRDIAEVEC